MKLNKIYKNNLILKWNKYYISPNIISSLDSLSKETNKLDDFVKNIKSNSNYNENDVSNFIIINYMSIIEIIKKYNISYNFFYSLENNLFYDFYLKLPRPCNKIKLIIFDKDGTLIKINSIFGRWIKLLVNKLEVVKDKNELLTYLGYNVINQKLNFNSIIAKGTNNDIKNLITAFLVERYNLSKIEIKNIYDKYWTNINIKKENIIECGNIIRVFNFLKENNIKIAICTSDDRNVTEKTIDILNIRKYISSLRCGSDICLSKPSPEPIWEICNELNINTSSVVMIGDTMSDIYSGINAKCGKVFGVLSGNYDEIKLSYADNIINTIDNLPNLLKQHNLV